MADKDYAEDLFQAVDTIVHERTRHLPYDQTIVATITNNNKAYVGLYQVTTDSNIQFNAYSSNFDYNVGDMVYVRIPGGDYTKQKVIVDKYVAESTISADFTNGVFYRDTQASVYVKDANSNTILINTADKYQGYNGFNLFCEAIAPGRVDIQVSVRGKNYTELNSTEASIVTFDSRTILYTESNLIRNISYQLININPEAIIIQGATNLKVTLTLGYLWQERFDTGVFKALLYNADNKSTYYNPEADRFLCRLGAKLLLIGTDENGFIATPQSLTTAAFLLGLNEGIEEPSYNVALDGNYDIISGDNLEDATYYKKFDIIIHPNLQLAAQLARVKCQFKTSNNITAISNEYIIYSQTKLSSKYKIFTLTATPNEFYVFNSAGSCLTNNTTCVITLTYLNKINTDDIITNISHNLNNIAYFTNISQTSNNGKTIQYTCTIGGTLQNTVDIVPIEFTINKDDNIYVVTTTLYFGQIRIDSSDTTGLQLWLNNTDKLNYYQLTDNNSTLFSLSGNTLTIGGQAVSTTGTWGGTAASADVATALSSNAGAATQPIYFANGIPVAITSTIGASNKPIYANAGVLTSINSLDDTLLGFTDNTYGFTTTGKNTKLYAWLKAIQTNINTLAAKHTDVTVSWPGNITL